ncbi:MAG: transporter substrate-binding domain-containing protein [Bacteroidota bacterium]
MLLFLAAAPAWGGPDETPLRVGVHPFPPFIIEAPEGQFTGLCVDVWEEIAEDLGVDYEYVPYTERIGMVRALDYGEIDLAINPLHVSRIRLSMFEVSQPFFISSVGVATPSATRNQFQVFIQNLFSLSFLKVVLFLFVVMLFFGTLLWIVERRDNHYQFRPGFNGLLDGLWWAAVTMTTVGYGDKAPKTQAGKAIAVVWMFSAVIIVSGFTATIASTLTVNSLTSGLERLEELKVVERVGTVSATSSEDFLISNGILPTHAFETPRQALRSLAEGEVDAIVYDRTVMRYLIDAERLDGLIQVLPATFNKQYRSFLMPRGSPLRQQIDPLLVSRINQADWQDVLRKYNLEEDV